MYKELDMFDIRFLGIIISSEKKVHVSVTSIRIKI